MNPKYFVFAAAICSTALFASVMSGCSGDSTSPDSEPTTAADPAIQSYNVLGVIETLPDPANPASEFRIAHEEIPDFVGREGDVVGMKAMTMPFPLAEGVSIDGFDVDDTVRFTFTVNWAIETGYPWQLTAIEKIDNTSSIDAER